MSSPSTVLPTPTSSAISSPNRVEAQCHEQRHKLVGARADGHAAQRTEWRCAFSQREPRRLPKQMCARDIGQVVGIGRREFCRIDAFFGERVANQIGQPLVDCNHLVGRAGQRPEQQKIFLVAWQEHPFAIRGI